MTKILECSICHSRFFQTRFASALLYSREPDVLMSRNSVAFSNTFAAASAPRFASVVQDDGTNRSVMVPLCEVIEVEHSPKNYQRDHDPNEYETEQENRGP